MGARKQTGAENVRREGTFGLIPRKTANQRDNRPLACRLVPSLFMLLALILAVPLPAAGVTASAGAGTVVSGHPYGSPAQVAEAEALAAETIPVAPAVLTAKRASASQINLSWQDKSNNETTFRIERKTGTGGTYAEIATVGGGVTSYANTGLAASTTYLYRVRAGNSAGNSGYSNEASANTGDYDLYVAASAHNSTWRSDVDLLNMGAAAASVQIALLKQGNNNSSPTTTTVAVPAGQTVRMSDILGSTFSAANAALGFRYLSGTALANSRFYNIGTGAGTYGMGLMAEAESLTLCGDGITKGVFHHLGYSPSTNSGYRTNIGLASTCAFPVTVVTRLYGDAGQLQGSQTKTLQPYEQFQYTKIHEAIGVTTVVNHGHATVEVTTPGGKIHAYAMTIDNKSQDPVYWPAEAIQSPSFPTALAASPDGYATDAEFMAAGSPADPYPADPGLADAATDVESVTTDSLSGPAPDDASFAAAAPVAPSHLVARRMSSSYIRLTWQDNAGDESGFRIERKTGTGGTYAEIGTVGANFTSYANTGLAASTTYFYRLRAYNASGNSGYTNEASASTGDYDLYIAASAHNSTWRSDVDLLNAGASAASVQIALLKQGNNNSSPTTTTVAVPAGQTVRMSDILGSTFSAANAALGFRFLSGTVKANCRFYNIGTGQGTYGMGLPAEDESQAQCGDGYTRGVFHHLGYSPSTNSGYRTNIGLASASAFPVTVVVKLYGDTGELLGSQTKTLQPYEQFQYTKIHEAVGVTTVINHGHATVEVTTPGGKIHSYAMTIDNKSQDPVYWPAELVSIYSLTIQKAGTGTGTVTSSPAGINCGATCSATFLGGTSVQLTAAAAAGSTFAGWSGDASGSTSPVSVSMNRHKAVTATFNSTPSTYTLTIIKAGTGSGTVASTPLGIACGATCSATFSAGSTVQLNAVPAIGSTFANWTGDASGTALNTSVVMNGNKTVTATFNLPPATYTLTVIKAGNGSGTVTSTPAGISCGATCSFSFNANSTVQLSAAAAGGSTFSGWSGDAVGAGGLAVVIMTGNKTVTATFNTTASLYTLTVIKAGSGTGTVMTTGGEIMCGPICAASFAPGTSLTLMAIPDEGVVFSGWSGAVTGSAFMVGVIMDSDKTVTATFGTQAMATLTLTKAGSGSGTVTDDTAAIDCGDTCSADFPVGTVVNLEAVADTGSMFAGWSGDASGTTARTTVTMSTGKNVTATFNTQSTLYALTILKAGTGTGTVTSSPTGIDCGQTCTMNIPAGTTVQLMAAADTGSVFGGWSGSETGPETTLTFTMNGIKTITATFNIPPRLLRKTLTGQDASTDRQVDVQLLAAPALFILSGTVTAPNLVLEDVQATLQSGTDSYWATVNGNQYQIELPAGTYLLDVVVSNSAATFYKDWTDPAVVVVAGNTTRNITVPAFPAFTVSGTVSGLSNIAGALSHTLEFTSQDDTIWGSLQLPAPAGNYSTQLPNGVYTASLRSSQMFSSLEVVNLGQFTVNNANLTVNFTVPALPAIATLSGQVTLTGITMPDTAFMTVATSLTQGPANFRYSTFVQINPAGDYSTSVYSTWTYDISIMMPLSDQSGLFFPVPARTLLIPGNTTSDFLLGALPPYVTIHGKVTGPDAKGVSEVDVTANGSTLTGLPNTGFNVWTMTDSGGNYSFQLLKGTQYTLTYLPPEP